MGSANQRWTERVGKVVYACMAVVGLVIGFSCGEILFLSFILGRI